MMGASDNLVRESDILIIGGGIAGASLAYEIAPFASAIVLEREDQCGYHATGRSAASFTENYGTAVIRRLAIASRPFLENPPPGFCEYPILLPRGMITIAREDQLDALAEELRRARLLVPSIEPIDSENVLRRVPVIRRDYLAGAIIEPFSMEVDVNGLHRGFLAGAKAKGVPIVTKAEVQTIARLGSVWQIATTAGLFRARTLVNAAGAWADEVARMAGLMPIGLQPKRRTAFNVPAPQGLDIGQWPLINDVGEEFYFKPDAGQLFVSPSDATPSEPMDAYPDDMDVAQGVERLQRATTMIINRVSQAWAGLRTFAADGSPVVGPDPQEQSFVWLAGQGGYGIKTSPALARACAEMILHDRLPASLTEAGVRRSDVAPNRFKQRRGGIRTLPGATTPP
jgi:D-arginine dehydrogenase